MKNLILAGLVFVSEYKVWPSEFFAEAMSRCPYGTKNHKYIDAENGRFVSYECRIDGESFSSLLEEED